MPIFSPNSQPSVLTRPNSQVASATLFHANSYSSQEKCPLRDTKQLSVSMWVYIPQDAFDTSPDSFDESPEDVCKFTVSPNFITVVLHDVNGNRVPDSDFVAHPNPVFIPNDWNWMRFSVNSQTTLPLKDSEWGFPTLLFQTDVADSIAYAEVLIYIDVAIDFDQPEIFGAFAQMKGLKEYPQYPQPVRLHGNRGNILFWRPNALTFFPSPVVAFYGYDKWTEDTPPFFWENKGASGHFGNVGSIDTYGPGPGLFLP